MFAVIAVALVVPQQVVVVPAKREKLLRGSVNVTDKNGKPVPNATVSYGIKYTNTFSVSGTGPKGNAPLKGLRQGKEYLLTVKQGGRKATTTFRVLPGKNYVAVTLK